MSEILLYTLGVKVEPYTKAGDRLIKMIPYLNGFKGVHPDGDITWMLFDAKMNARVAYQKLKGGYKLEPIRPCYVDERWMKTADDVVDDSPSIFKDMADIIQEADKVYEENGRLTGKLAEAEAEITALSGTISRMKEKHVDELKRAKKQIRELSKECRDLEARMKEMEEGQKGEEYDIV